MTEPAVASSDASNIATTIRKTSDGYAINGRKWWSSGAMGSDCKILIVMGVTGKAAAGNGPGNGQRHGRHSMVLVPRDTPGVEIRRGMRVFGYTDGTHGGHAEIDFTDVHVPWENLIAGEGEGFAIAQARLGPGASTTHAADGRSRAGPWNSCAQRALSRDRVRQTAGRAGGRSGVDCRNPGSGSSRPGCSCSRPRG